MSVCICVGCLHSSAFCTCILKVLARNMHYYISTIETGILWVYIAIQIILQSIILLSIIFYDAPKLTDFEERMILNIPNYWEKSACSPQKVHLMIAPEAWTWRTKILQNRHVSSLKLNFYSLFSRNLISSVENMWQIIVLYILRYWISLPESLRIHYSTLWTLWNSF